MTSASCTSACSAPQVNRDAAPVVSLLLLFRDTRQPGPEALFPTLLNDLCVCGHGISSAGLREGRIDVALDGHRFTLGPCTQAPRCADEFEGDIPQPHRPNLPQAAMRSAALGLTFVRHRVRYPLQFAPDTPDAVVAALLRTLFQHLCPDAVLLDPQRLMLTSDEALQLPLSDLLVMKPGASLPQPMPRYERPAGLAPVRRKSVFARKEAGKEPDPANAERIGSAPTLAAAPTPPLTAFSATRHTLQKGNAPARQPELAAQTGGTRLRVARLDAGMTKPEQDAHRSPDIALTRNMGPVLRAAAPARAPVAMRDRASTLVVSSASVLCDGLTVMGPNGEKRVVATHLLTASVLFGLSSLLASGISGMAGHVIALI